MITVVITHRKFSAGSYSIKLIEFAGVSEDNALG